MKKLLLLFLFVIALHSAKAQKKPLAFGVKAGIGLNIERGEIGTLNGAFFSRFAFSQKLFIQPELEFAYHKQRLYFIDGYIVDSEFRYVINSSSIRLPVVVKYYIHSLYFELGPYAMVNLTQGGFGGGLQGGVGVDINDKFCIGARFNTCDFSCNLYETSLCLNFGIMF